MAEIDSNATPSLGELVNRLYDVQALMQCASASLDEDGDGNAIRVLRHAEAVTQEEINHLDSIDLRGRVVLQVAELARTGSDSIQ
ncbi:MAG: hypothetical protein H6R13_686 [Proteobacteria bacterium]|nr:hypothetical protein [Pseudomonadota bacterium]